MATIAGPLIGVAMVGAIGYLPTYLQMAFSVNATTDSGLLMISMMGALLVASVVSGQLVPKTGRYKWMPIACSSQRPAGTNEGGHHLLL